MKYMRIIDLLKRRNRSMKNYISVNNKQIELTEEQIKQIWVLM